MKMSAKHLKQMIKEELAHLIQEGEVYSWASQVGLDDTIMGEVLIMPGGMDVLVTMMKHDFKLVSHGAMGLAWQKEMTIPNNWGKVFKESHTLTFIFPRDVDAEVVYTIESDDPNNSHFYREFNDLYAAKEFIEKRMEGEDADGAPNPMFRGLGL